MTTVLRSYLGGRWVAGEGRRTPLYDPTTEEPLAETCTDGLDFGAALSYARERGGPSVRAMTFSERGELLGKMASALHDHRDELLALSTKNGGNTRGDAKFDVDGATGTLAYYAKLGKSLGERRFLIDGDQEQLARNPRYIGQHIRVPRHGVAVHINAFNFPAWGFCEKAATAILAGMPVVTKPATSTALLAVRMFELLVDAEVLPDGVLSLVTGSAGDLLEHLDVQDVLAFTGSADTAAFLRAKPRLIELAVPFNVEADSLNAAVLGPDWDPDSETYQLFIREVIRDMTQKAGQKCTAIRRIFVPGDALEQVRADLCEEIRRYPVGDPSLREVRVGPVATQAQLRDVRAGIGELAKVARFVCGDGGRGELVGITESKGYFVGPTLLEAASIDEAALVHELEVFGPVQTLIPYDGSASEAVRGVRLGKGGLVSSVYTDDKKFAAALVLGLAPYHGRLHIGSGKIAGHSPGPGTVLPQMVHGGPGRAGSGEELGGVRGMHLYSQRTAVQGLKTLVEKITSG